MSSGGGTTPTRIAVVEDDADAREVLADLLREEGYDVLAFGDGAEAFRVLRTTAAPDLILLDLRLPTMDGWEFRVQQKRDPRLAQTPVIALSADRSSQAQAIDADEFLEKPPRLERLLGTITSVLDRAAERRRRANQIALESMAAIGQLAAGVAHEINNPLAYVSGNLHVLREEVGRLRAQVKVSEETSASFEEIEAMLSESLVGAERIRDIVRDMRLLAQIEDTGAEPVDLHSALDAAIGVAQNLGVGRANVLQKYGDPPDVLANQGRLVHVFFNLISNALQSIPETRKDGVVTIETSATPDGSALVRVRDNGVGIPREIRGRIFEPFFTTRAIGAGRGLGLSVVQGIVSALSGRLDMESEVGKGTTFTVTIPGIHAKSGKPAKPAPAPSTPLRRVLVIDDEPAIGRVLERVLKGEFIVTVAGSGREGLELAMAVDYDAILCDLFMDDVSGVDIYHKLAHERPGKEKKLVFMSGGVFNESEAIAKIKPRVLLDKPLDAGALLAALRDVTASK